MTLRLFLDSQATGNRIYVGNLAWNVEWQELKDYMRSVGKVVHADVLQDADGRSKVCNGGVIRDLMVFDMNVRLGHVSVSGIDPEFRVLSLQGGSLNPSMLRWAILLLEG